MRGRSAPPYGPCGPGRTLRLYFFLHDSLLFNLLRWTGDSLKADSMLAYCLPCPTYLLHSTRVVTGKQILTD